VRKAVPKTVMVSTLDPADGVDLDVAHGAQDLSHRGMLLPEIQIILLHHLSDPAEVHFVHRDSSSKLECLKLSNLTIIEHPIKVRRKATGE
jgi:hypothetical protein